ncbi:putative peptidoglycan biosynthesis protein MurJ (plasmid) [Hartmannibacter diazotrophicus]|uniref:Probable lipid II flippase MurJ n=1 Tax=Hartmannibacter diazotrophicus TaxID=1482074 RepID=A0A2C9DDS1_9HYPH|nr:murein biosynthesis integral membrane protein MurJ [Hartmannibacter diazotrophicus]SON58416.1 putative peptidoglycan biosynthesis protein MurJ [Hartmannibacter diazotrophicus]
MLRKLGTVSGLTLASRLLGFLRDVVLAATLGAGPVADSFMLAFRLPNHFRAIFAEGAFNAAFLPTWATAEAKGEDSATLGAQVLGWLTLANLVMLALALGATGWVLAALAPGLSATDPRWALTVTLTRITFPYLLCMSLVAFLSALLNSRDRFAAAAGAPILLNLSMICSLLLADHFPSAAHAAAWGVLIAGLAQVSLLAVSTVKAGIPLPWPRIGFSSNTRLFFRRLGPAILTSGALQVAIFADTIIATFLPQGSLSHLYYADRLYQLPIGLVGAALGTVILPDIGRRAGRGDETGMRKVLDRALLICLVMGVPMAVLMATLGEWAMRILFVRGAFDADAAQSSAAILAAYALGLVPALAVRSLVAGFNGRGDTKTPLKCLTAATIVNVVLKIVLSPSLGPVGLAVATSAGISLYALLLFRTGRTRGYLDRPPVTPSVILVGAGLISGIAIVLLKEDLLNYALTVTPEWGLLLAFGAVAGTVALFHGVFTLLALRFVRTKC